jgi:hypothetical protein
MIESSLTAIAEVAVDAEDEPSMGVPDSLMGSNWLLH